MLGQNIISFGTEDAALSFAMILICWDHDGEVHF